MKRVLILIAACLAGYAISGCACRPIAASPARFERDQIEGLRYALSGQNTESEAVDWLFARWDAMPPGELRDHYKAVCDDALSVHRFHIKENVRANR